MKKIINVSFSNYSYLVIVVSNFSSKLYYSNVIIEGGVLEVWVDVYLLNFYLFFVWRVVSNCLSFYLEFVDCF